MYELIALADKLDGLADQASAPTGMIAHADIEMPVDPKLLCLAEAVKETAKALRILAAQSATTRHTGQIAP